MSLLHSLVHGASPIYRGLAPCTSVSWVARENSRALMMKRHAQSLSYVGPIAARHSITLHLMQDLLHWAHKLARNGLVELGCVYNFEYMEKLLELLRATRLKNGISQDYLAVKLGVSSSSVSRWESKGNFPSVDKLFEYAELLGFTLQEVLALSANAPVEVPKPVGKIEISAYDKATFKRLVAQLLEEGDGNIEFVTTHLK